ncbi:MAG: hypothetical protein AAFP68_14610 [Pseudomonadota bacterium]
MIDLLKSLLRALLILLIPIILIFVGGAVVYGGVTFEIEFVQWGGMALIGVGVLWLILLWFGAESGSNPFGD